MSKKRPNPVVAKKASDDNIKAQILAFVDEHYPCKTADITAHVAPRMPHTRSRGISYRKARVASIVCDLIERKKLKREGLYIVLP